MMVSPLSPVSPILALIQTHGITIQHNPIPIPTVTLTLLTYESKTTEKSRTVAVHANPTLT